MKPLRARVYQGAIAMNGNSIFSKAPALPEPHNQIFGIIPRTLVGGVLLFCIDAVGVYSKHRKMGRCMLESKDFIRQIV